MFTVRVQHLIWTILISKALAALIRYLKEFGLSSMFHVGKYIKNFVSKSHMLLNANTLVNLEVYRNSTNYKEEGSLFSVLNHTQTKFGQRLLKRWVGRPLTDIEWVKWGATGWDELNNQQEIEWASGCGRRANDDR